MWWSRLRGWGGSEAGFGRERLIGIDDKQCKKGGLLPAWITFLHWRTRRQRAYIPDLHRLRPMQRILVLKRSGANIDRFGPGVGMDTRLASIGRQNNINKLEIYGAPWDAFQCWGSKDARSARLRRSSRHGKPDFHKGSRAVCVEPSLRLLPFRAQWSSFGRQLLGYWRCLRHTQNRARAGASPAPSRSSGLRPRRVAAQPNLQPAVGPTGSPAPWCPVVRGTLPQVAV